ncbi:hypothetical protein BDV23DRAFT_159844 [Aspergillus alliaceus]|uniref:Uncharacterized protein n=1 Tax=Petromyces alliaceus TaxID=209559 RepID=A0A5N7C1P4_PETAA|nr:hypothetical protein BDV23DRAFT_159844 [Aspergillus alliaceus]
MRYLLVRDWVWKGTCRLEGVGVSSMYSCYRMICWCFFLFLLHILDLDVWLYNSGFLGQLVTCLGGMRGGGWLVNEAAYKL